MFIPFIILCLVVSPLLSVFILIKLNVLSHKTLAVQKYACWGLALTFIFFFIGHFVKTDDLVVMLPPWLPFRLPIIHFTGIIELGIAIALFSKKYRQGAVRLAIVVFIAFFPANIYAAIQSIGSGGHQWGPIYLFVRAPLQIFLIAWSYYLCLERRGKTIFYE